jgi:hypothetical protein
MPERAGRGGEAMNERAWERLIAALENLAEETERLRLLREYELNAHVHTYPSGDVWVEEGRDTPTGGV